jgi:hypothetical protein
MDTDPVEAGSVSIFFINIYRVIPQDDGWMDDPKRRS